MVCSADDVSTRLEASSKEQEGRDGSEMHRSDKTFWSEMPEHSPQAFPDFRFEDVSLDVPISLSPKLLSLSDQRYCLYEII